MMTATGPRWSAGGSVEVTRSCLRMVDTSGIGTNDCAQPAGSGGQGCRGPIARIQQQVAGSSTLVDHGAGRGRGPGILRTEGRPVGSGFVRRCLLDVWAPSRSNPRTTWRAECRHQAPDWQEDTAPGSDVNLLRHLLPAASPATSFPPPPSRRLLPAASPPPPRGPRRLRCAGRTGLSGLVGRRYDLVALNRAATVSLTEKGRRPLRGVSFG